MLLPDGLSSESFAFMHHLGVTPGVPRNHIVDLDPEAEAFKHNELRSARPDICFSVQRRPNQHDPCAEESSKGDNTRISSQLGKLCGCVNGFVFRMKHVMFRRFEWRAIARCRRDCLWPTACIQQTIYRLINFVSPRAFCSVMCGFRRLHLRRRPVLHGRLAKSLR